MANISQKIINQLDTVLDDIVEHWQLPGLAVGIVDQNETAYIKTTGVQSLLTGSPVTADTLFCTASVSKTYIANTILQLVEKGLVELDTPIPEYLPYFDLADGQADQITLKSILSHTSGIPDMSEMEYIQMWKKPETDAGAAERYVRGLSHLKLVHPPGQKFLYSNIAYNIAGDLITKVTGMPAEIYIRQNILTPAGMPNSTFLLEEVPEERLAVPHLRLPAMTVSPVYPYHRADAPSSNLHTSILDLCNWAKTNLNQGTLNGDRILQPASYQKMWTPMVERTWPPLYRAMGLGWVLGSYEGQQTICHGGGGAGMNAFLLLLPGTGRAATMLVNCESPAHYNLIDAVLDSLVDREPKPGSIDWVVPICKAFEEGGREKAFEVYETLKGGNQELVRLEEDSLISVVFQMVIADLFESALDLLDLTIYAFPEFSYAVNLRAQVADAFEKRKDVSS